MVDFEWDEEEKLNEGSSSAMIEGSVQVATGGFEGQRRGSRSTASCDRRGSDGPKSDSALAGDSRNSVVAASTRGPVIATSATGLAVSSATVILVVTSATLRSVVSATANGHCLTAFG